MSDILAIINEQVERAKIMLAASSGPNLSDGHTVRLWGQNVYVPDPREPGCVRRLCIKVDMCFRLEPDEVELFDDGHQEV